MAEQLFSLHFPANAERLTLVRCLVKRAVEVAGCCEDLTEKLVIALNEACMNIIQHAYEGCGTGEVILDVQSDGADLIFRLTDHAKPVDLACVQPRDLDDIRPGGLGVHFIREIMDEYEMGHLGGGKGNYLEMRKKIA